MPSRSNTTTSVDVTTAPASAINFVPTLKFVFVRLATASHVLRIVYGTPEPVHAQNLLLQLGYSGSVPIDFTYAETKQILRVETNGGPVIL